MRADDFGPTDADEDVAQKAEELKYVPAAILPSKAEVESHSVSHLQFRIWCPACVRGRGFSLGHRKIDTKTKEAEQIPTVWITGSLCNLKTEHMTHFQCSSCEIARVKASGVTRMPSTGVTHPFPARALMADVDFVGYRRVILKADQEPSIVALCDAVKNGWHGGFVPEASPKGESKRNGEVERAVQ